MNTDDNDSVLDPDVIEALKSLSDEGDPGLFGELVEMFLDDTPMRLASIREAVEVSDAKALEAAAHSLKSSCGNLGAIKLADLCRDLERLGREGQLEGASSLSKQSTDEFARVHDALRAELD